MPPNPPDDSLTLDPGFLQQMLDGGPLYLLFNGFFVMSVLLSLVVVIRRAPLPWMLLVSCQPFIWASAAAHISFLSHLMVLDTSALSAPMVAPFVSASRLFNSGWIISIALIVLALLCRPKNARP